jgi:hypothetical protein
MDEQQRAAKKKYASEKKPSMKRRDDNHDYTERRMYMITMEVVQRQPLFGTLVGNPFAANNSSEAPRIELSPLGKAVQDEWLGIPRYYPQIEVIAIQMMPDHMHGILFVRQRIPVHLSQVITGFKTGCNRLLRAATKPQHTEKPSQQVATKPQHTEKPSQQVAEKPSQQAAAPPQHSGKSAPSASLQAAAPPQLSPQPLPRLFEPGFNDLILRSYDELEVWKNYLLDNPRRLLMKRARPEFLYPFFNLAYGPYVFNGIGNRALLSAPRRMNVRISRRLTPEQLEMEVARYLAAARSGTVLISPAISPGEKRVMRTAFDEGLPTVVIMENGFTPLSKPHGEQFNACAEGRLLMLSPWEHHNERRHLTASMCQQMNIIALELSQKEY